MPVDQFNPRPWARRDEDWVFDQSSSVVVLSRDDLTIASVTIDIVYSDTVRGLDPKEWCWSHVVVGLEGTSRSHVHEGCTSCRLLGTSALHHGCSRACLTSRSYKHYSCTDILTPHDTHMNHECSCPIWFLSAGGYSTSEKVFDTPSNPGST